VKGAAAAEPAALNSEWRRARLNICDQKGEGQKRLIKARFAAGLVKGSQPNKCVNKMLRANLYNLAGHSSISAKLKTYMDAFAPINAFCDYKNIKDVAQLHLLTNTLSESFAPVIMQKTAAKKFQFHVNYSDNVKV
jgi:hypothetical protein